MRSGVWVIGLVGGVSLACAGGEVPTEVEEPVAAPVVEAPVIEVEPPEVEVTPLQALVATSNSGDVALVLDRDEGTSWTPSGDAASEGILVRFERPRTLASVQVKACGDEPLDLGLYVNGDALGVQQGSDVRFDLPSGGVRSVFVKIRTGATACISELVLSDVTGPLVIGPPRSVAARVDVSSTLEPHAAYHANYLFDGRSHFGWVEGAEGAGDGESIQLTFRTEQPITGVEFWNGYHRSQDHFDKNARVRKLELEAQGRRVMLDVPDGMAPRRIELDPPVSARVLTLTVAASKKGTTFEDLVISEMRFYDRTGPFTIAPIKPTDLAQELADSIKGKPLASIVGRTYRQVCGLEREFKLRGDYSFVYTERSETDDVSQESFLDGAWVPQKGALKLYGRRHLATQEFSPYGGVRPEASTEITGGEITVRAMEDIGDDDFLKLLETWNAKGAKDRVDCLMDGRQPDVEKIKALRERGQVVVVEGKAITDVMVHAP